VNNLDGHGGRVGNAHNHAKLMKTPLIKLLVSVLFVATCAHLQARFVTLTLNGNPNAGPTNLLAELTIKSNEVATVRFTTPTSSGASSVFLNVIKDGITVGAPYAVGTVIAGPAVFQVTPQIQAKRSALSK